MNLFHCFNLLDHFQNKCKLQFLTLHKAYWLIWEDKIHAYLMHTHILEWVYMVQSKRRFKGIERRKTGSITVGCPDGRNDEALATTWWAIVEFILRPKIRSPWTHYSFEDLSKYLFLIARKDGTAGVGCAVWFYYLNLFQNHLHFKTHVNYALKRQTQQIHTPCSPFYFSKVS